MIQRLILLCTTLTMVCLARGSDSSSTSFPLIRVTDREGKAIVTAEAAVRKVEHIPNFIDGWYKADREGVVRVDGNRAKGSWDNAIATGKYLVVLRSPGFAPALVPLDVPSTAPEIAVAMERGKEVELRLTPYAGSKLPADLVPLAVDARLLTTTLRSYFPGTEYNKTGEPLRLYDVTRSEMDGLFRVRVPETCDLPLRLAVAHPGYLRNYLSEELSAADLAAGKGKVELPLPGTLKINVRPKETTAPATFKLQDVTVAVWQEKLNTLPLSIAGTDRVTTELTDVVSGVYGMTVRAPVADAKSEKFPVYSTAELAVYHDDPTTVSAGNAAEVQVRYPLLATDYFDGDGSVTIALKSASGKTFAGFPYRVTAQLDDYQFVPVRKGEVGPGGVVQIDSLRRDGVRYYEFQVGKVHSSIFTFRDRTHIDVTRYVAPGKEDVAPELEAWDVHTSRPLSISDLKGKVVLLEFWATWCGPCQANMQKLVDISRDLPADLRDRVALISISTDDDVPEVKKHLEEKRWTDGGVEHYWFGPGQQSARGGSYGVSGIPHAVIIGPDGRIAEPNYHVSDDLVERLQELLR